MTALTVSCLSKIQIVFTFLVPADPGSPRQRAVKWLRVRVYILYGLSLVVVSRRHTMYTSYTHIDATVNCYM